MPDPSRISLITRLDPPGLPSAVGYCQVTVAAGTRTVYVSGQGAVFEASAAVFGLDAPPMAVTLVGVAALADPAYKIEIEATAVLP